jgi:hypothetical protein
MLGGGGGGFFLCFLFFFLGERILCVCIFLKEIILFSRKVVEMEREEQGR